VPPDDPSIPDDARLLRRIFPGWYKGEGPEAILTSQAFDDAPDGSSMSVFVERRLAELGLTPMDVLADHDGYGLVALEAGLVRRLDFGITWSPDATDGLRGQAHAEVHGNKSPGKRKRLRDLCVHIVGPLAR
jgi:hypothetical protein